MADILALIVVLAISIALGSVLSWYMAIKLMSGEKGKKVIKKAVTDYTEMAFDASKEAIDKTYG